MKIYNEMANYSNMVKIPRKVKINTYKIGYYIKKMKSNKEI